MKPAPVEHLYITNFRAVPATLRQLASAIEHGDYGEVGCCAVVVLGDKLNVFGMGPDSEGPSVHLVLCAGAEQLVQGVLEHGRE